MIYGIGTDICDIRRIQSSCEKFGDKFAQKILTTAEFQTYLQRQQNSMQRGVSYLATRWAAKEAFSKAIGLGMRAPMNWHDCAVVADELGKPSMHLYGALLAWFDERQLVAHISITDEKDYAAAFVVVERRQKMEHMQ